MFNKCSIKVADDWIRTQVLWYQKRPLCQLRHNHCPTAYFVSYIVTYLQNNAKKVSSIKYGRKLLFERSRVRTPVSLIKSATDLLSLRYLPNCSFRSKLNVPEVKSLRLKSRERDVFLTFKISFSFEPETVIGGNI